MFECLSRKPPSYGGFAPLPFHYAPPQPSKMFDYSPFHGGTYRQLIRDEALKKPNAYIQANLNRSRELYEDLGYDVDEWPFTDVPSTTRPYRYQYHETPRWDQPVAVNTNSNCAWPVLNRETVYPPASSYVPRFRNSLHDAFDQHPCNSFTHGSWGSPPQYITGDLRDPKGHTHWGYNWPTMERVKVPPPKHKGPKYMSGSCPCGCMGTIGAHYSPCCT